MKKLTRFLIFPAVFIGATFSQAVAADPAPSQPFETSLWVNEIEYACVTDPSSWRQPNADHDALEAQGYSTRITIATHPGFTPFSDQLYFQCRTPGPK